MIQKGWLSVLFLLFVMFTFNATYAQNIKFEHITDNEGLPQSVINCVYQDSYGFMWFGTQNGLARYDGYSVTVYQNKKGEPTSISNNVIRTIIQDNDGFLWVGTMGGGLNRYDYIKNEFTRFKPDEKKKGAISSNDVLSSVLDKEGNLWVGTLNGGVCKYNKASQTFDRLDFDTSDERLNAAHCLVLDKDGFVWAGGNESYLYRINTDEGSVRGYQDSSPDRAEIKSIVESKMGFLWIGLRGEGFGTFDKNTGVFTKRRREDEASKNNLVGLQNTVHCLYESEDGKLWIGTQEGLSIYDFYKDRFKNIVQSDDEFGLSNSDIKCIYKDRFGSVWLGTQGGGVNVYHKNNLKFQHFKNDDQDPYSIRSNVVFSFLEDSDSLLWVGTYEGGITVVDRDNETSKHYSKQSGDIEHNSILSMIEDRDRIVWIGTYGGGLLRYDKNKEEFISSLRVDNSELLNNTIFSLKEDVKGQIWIGTYKGINIYNKETKEFKKIGKSEGLESPIITSICMDDNYAWVGTLRAGLFSVDLKTYEVQGYAKEDEPDGVSNNRVNTVLDNQRGGLWVGTNNGLNYFDKTTHTFKQFFKEDGLPDNYIYGILEDNEGFIWMSTNKGISKLNPTFPIIPEYFRNYGKDDALQDNEFNQNAYYKSPRTGELLFGGVNGYNSFFPEEIEDNTNKPPVYITSIKCFDKELELDSNVLHKQYIQLDYQQNYLSFEFVGLDYFYPSKNQYKFKLEGVDDKWNVSGSRRFASYPNLDGGHYVFKVQASNSDGIWNEEGVAIHIYIVPPFWETDTFYVLVVLLTVVIIISIYKIRTKKIIEENRRLEEQVNIRTKELAEKNKDITSSIEYAKRLQDAILPSIKQLRHSFPDSFVLYLPKDIVSGDFYWFAEKDGRKIIVASDCTGHGVPGAFMSMLGINLLNSIIIEKGITRPDLILNELHLRVVEALHNSERENDRVNDGMDLSLVCIDEENRVIEYAGAYNPLLMLKKEENDLVQIKADKQPIGGNLYEGKERVFTLNSLDYRHGDEIYLFSDGFIDQFGGPKGKKFMIKRFKQLILDTLGMSKKIQKIELETRFNEWKGKEEQIDDVIVIGIKL